MARGNNGTRKLHAFKNQLLLTMLLLRIYRYRSSVVGGALSRGKRFMLAALAVVEKFWVGFACSVSDYRRTLAINCAIAFSGCQLDFRPLSLTANRTFSVCEHHMS